MFIKEDIIKLKDLSLTSNNSPIWLKERIRRPGTFLYYNFLFNLAKQYQPRIVIETGCNQGISAAHFKLGYRKGRVFTIDINIPLHVGQFLKDNEIEFREIDSVQFLKTVNTLIDVAFLDSLHTYEHVKAEYEAVRPLIHKGGIILFDDIRLDEGMTKFWEELPDNKIDLSELHPTVGFGGIIL